MDCPFRITRWREMLLLHNITFGKVYSETLNGFEWSRCWFSQPWEHNHRFRYVSSVLVPILIVSTLKLCLPVIRIQSKQSLQNQHKHTSFYCNLVFFRHLQKRVNSIPLIIISSYFYLVWFFSPFVSLHPTVPSLELYYYFFFSFTVGNLMIIKEICL